MKQKIFISAIMLTFCITSYAVKMGSCGKNVEYVLDDDGTLTIYGSGDTYNEARFELFNLTSYIKKVIIEEGVTSIGERLFEQCEELTSITIPNSVTSIGKDAFSHCSSLTSVTIPNSVRSIGNGAFYYCSSLTSVTIPSYSPYLTHLEIGGGAFSNCNRLKSVYITDLVTWCKIEFESSASNPLLYNANLYLNGELVKDLIIPNSVTRIGRYAFYGCSSLTSVTIPNSVTSIDSCAFYYCSSLTSISIPNSVTSIGNRAFDNCSSLTSITIPNSVTSIGTLAFGGCSSLTSVTISNSVKRIGEGTFLGCRSLTSISIPNSVTSIDSCAFSGCSSLTSISIPNSVTSIGGRAFYDCSSLTSISIPNSVTSIGISAFNRCSSLTSITISNSMTHIANYTFSRCSSLTSVTIPNSVKSIGEGAFASCSKIKTLILGKSIAFIDYDAFYKYNITNIYCYAKSVPDIFGSSFDFNGNSTLWIPKTMLSTYKRNKNWEYWQNFNIRIIPDNVNTDKVVIKTYNNTAEMIWPKVDGVNSYDFTITDTKGNKICVLTFNADGQLQNISFKAPSIEHNNAPQQAQSTGFSFTVTGLDANTTYRYKIEAKDINNAVIETFEGEFTTDGGIYDSLEEIENENNTIKTQKIYEKGQVIIVTPNGKKFNVNGVEIK